MNKPFLILFHFFHLFFISFLFFFYVSYFISFLYSPFSLPCLSLILFSKSPFLLLILSFPCLRLVFFEKQHQDPSTCKLHLVATFNWKTVCKMVQSGLAFIVAVAQRIHTSRCAVINAHCQPETQ